MKNTEMMLRSLVGPVRIKIKPIAVAVEVAEELMFDQGVDRDDIYVTKHVYPMVAKRLGITQAAATRSIERAANLCLAPSNVQRLEKLVGRRLNCINAPSDIIFYLAYYRRFGRSYYEVIEKMPCLMF